MKKNNVLIKSTLTCLLIGCLFSVSFSATTQRGLDILQQLEDDGRTNDEIRVAMEDLGYNSNEYLGTGELNIKVIVANSTTENTNQTNKQGLDVINQLKNDGRTDAEIKETMENMGLDSSGYFSTNNSSQSYTGSSTGSKYISRSCKPYNIEYISSLKAYTSPDFNKKEYFVSIDYLKRYVDSKNAQNAECYTNRSWITTSYEDRSNGTDRYIAPNGKIYFISKINGLYTSNELNVQKSFSTIDELKNHIKTRNPLISMGIAPQTQKTIASTSTQSQNNSKIIYSDEDNTEEDDQMNVTENDDSIIKDLRKELFE